MGARDLQREQRADYGGGDGETHRERERTLSLPPIVTGGCTRLCQIVFSRLRVQLYTYTYVYFRTKVRKYESTKVLKYESTFVQRKLLLYTYSTYEAYILPSNVLSYFRTFVLSYLRRYFRT